MWGQALAAGLLAGLVLWRLEPGRRGALLLGATLAVLSLESVNALLPLWRYTLLPADPVVRGSWWGLFSCGGALWVAGMPRAMGLAGGRNRPGRWWADPLAALLAALIWLVLMAGLGWYLPSGVRLNLPLVPGFVVTGVTLAAGAWLGAWLGAWGGRRVAVGESIQAPVDPGAGAPSARWAWLAGPALIGGFLLVQGFSLASLEGRVRDLPGALPSEAEAMQLFGFPTISSLTRVSADDLVDRVPALNPDRAEQAVNAAGLAMHRGIGARFARSLWAVGIRAPADLGAWSPDALLEALAESAGRGGALPRRAWVDSWVRP